MLTWQEFSLTRPDLATIGAKLIYEHGGIGLGFLATVRADGGPRVHPICPVISEAGLHAFIVPGPKLADLRRDPRYALHSETFPPPQHDDAFYVTGHARETKDPAVRTTLAEQVRVERDQESNWPGFDEQVLIELLVDRCLLTLTIAQEGFPAGHTAWHTGTPA